MIESMESPTPPRGSTGVDWGGGAGEVLAGRDGLRSRCRRSGLSLDAHEPMIARLANAMARGAHRSVSRDDLAQEMRLALLRATLERGPLDAPLANSIARRRAIDALRTSGKFRREVRSDAILSASHNDSRFAAVDAAADVRALLWGFTDLELDVLCWWAEERHGARVRVDRPGSGLWSHTRKSARGWGKIVARRWGIPVCAVFAIRREVLRRLAERGFAGGKVA